MGDEHRGSRHCSEPSCSTAQNDQMRTKHTTADSLTQWQEVHVCARAKYFNKKKLQIKTYLHFENPLKYGKANRLYTLVTMLFRCIDTEVYLKSVKETLH